MQSGADVSEIRIKRHFCPVHGDIGPVNQSQAIAYLADGEWRMKCIRCMCDHLPEVEVR